MKISIIIPHHKETLQQLKPLLTMLDLQIDIDKKDYEVIIVNDCKSCVLTDFSLWPELQIKNLFNNKRGFPGISRQIGLDAAKGEWITFIDADDMILSINILSNFLALCAESQVPFDIARAGFFEETKEHTYFRHCEDTTWVFSKFYRRSFLTDNKIKFSDKLKYHEDTYFNTLLTAYQPAVANCVEPFYIWKYSKNSITRKNEHEYSYKYLPLHIDAVDYALDEISSRQKDGEQLTELVVESVSLMIYHYYYLNTYEFTHYKNYREAIPKIEQRLCKFIKKYRDKVLRFLQEDYNGFMLLLRDEYNKVAETSAIYLKETWDHFYERMIKE